MSYLVLILIAIVSFAIGRMTAKHARPTSGTFALRKPEELKEIQAEAREALTERTEIRKGKILHLMNREAVHQKELEACNVADIRKGITSANVEKLLDVSRGTARKYVNELERENKITQIGKTGRDVYYTLKTPNSTKISTILMES